MLEALLPLGQLLRAGMAGLLAAYAMLPLLVSIGLPVLVATSVGLGAPVAAWQAWRLLRGAGVDHVRWNSLGFWAVGLLMGTTTAEVLAFLHVAGWR